jgi:hypothetical protein
MTRLIPASRGLDDAHAWLPPPIARRFGRRLESLGWIRDDAWTPYCRRLRYRSQTRLFPPLTH